MTLFLGERMTSLLRRMSGTADQVTRFFRDPNGQATVDAAEFMQ